MDIIEQKIVIAEICLWRRVNHGEKSPLRRLTYGGNADVSGFWVGPKEQVFYDQNYLSHHDCLPPYPTSLDAMHEAEKFLRPPHWQDFSIWQIYLNYFEEDPHANAPQRAKAFIRTFGKWKG